MPRRDVTLDAFTFEKVLASKGEYEKLRQKMQDIRPFRGWKVLSALSAGRVWAVDNGR